MYPSIRAIGYVVAAADLGSITEAAARLNVSQPTVSSAVAQVETELGVQIFVRHHARGVSLTVAGQKFVNEARLLLDHARDFAQSVGTLGDALHGEIAVGAFVTLAVRFMPALLSTFARKYPGISIRLVEGHHEEVVQALLSGRTEVAISFGFTLPDDAVAERLLELPPYAMLPSVHPLAKRRAVALTELAKEPFILLDLPHSREYFLSLFVASGVEPRVAFRSSSYELIRGLVGRGLGYSLHNTVPRSTTAYDGSRVLVLPISGNAPPVQVVLLRLKRQTARPAVMAFVDFLHESFGPKGLFAPESLNPRNWASQRGKARRLEHRRARSTDRAQ